MTIFHRIKNLLKSEPEEQVLGYPPSELKLLFAQSAAATFPPFLKSYPIRSSLKPAGIDAVYTALLLDKNDIDNVMQRIEAHFTPESTRQFQGAEVMQCRGRTNNERLCYLVSNEFGGHVIRLLTDSLAFLNEMDEWAFSVPPPWVAFDNYNPQWWGGSMQGAPGYYDEHFFFAFFQNLDAGQRRAYCDHYGASPEWQQALEISHSADENDR